MRSRFSRFRLSPAFPISLLALFVALGGIAGAAATIGTKQLKNNSVTSKKIKNGTIKQGDLGFKVSGGAQGPAGPPGPPGTNGTNGSARAYGEITASAPFFDAARSKNVASVTNPSTGTFCVTFTAAAGIDPATTGAATAADFALDSTDPGPPLTTDQTAWAEWASSAGTCPATAMRFRTGVSQAGGAGEGNTDSNEEFFFVVP